MFKKKIAQKLFSLIPVGMLYMSSPWKNFTTDKQKQNVELQKQKEVCALVIGPSGAGKTTICNFIFGNEELQSSASQSQRTTKIIEKTKMVQSLKHGEVKVTLIDSVGFLNIDQKEKDRLNQLIEKMKQISLINKIILVVPYKERIELRDHLLVGALSYCIKFTSSSLLVIVNKVEEPYNPFGDDDSIAKEASSAENLMEIRQSISKYVKSGFQYIDINRYSKRDPFLSLQKKELKERILESLLHTKPLDKKDLCNWDEFYSDYLKNNLAYHQRMKTKIEQSIQDWEDYFKSVVTPSAAIVATYFSKSKETEDLMARIASSFFMAARNLISSDNKQLKYHEEQIKKIETKDDDDSGDKPEIEQINTFLNQKSSDEKK